MKVIRYKKTYVRSLFLFSREKFKFNFGRPDRGGGAPNDKPPKINHCRIVETVYIHLLVGGSTI